MAKQAVSMYKEGIRKGIEQGRKIATKARQKSGTSLRTQKARGRESILKVTGSLSSTGTSMPRKMAKQAVSMYKLGVEQGQKKAAKPPTPETQKSGSSLRTQKTKERKSVMKVTGYNGRSLTGKSMPRKTAKQVTSMYKLGVKQGQNKSKAEKN